MSHAHVFIALNRLWAVSSSVSYRQHRNKTATIVCLLAWTYVHLLVLPGLVLDAAYYRLPEETNGCQVNTDVNKWWWIAIQFLLFNIPEAVILTVYLVVCYRTIKRRQSAVQPVQRASRLAGMARSTHGHPTSTGPHHSAHNGAAPCSRYVCWRLWGRRSEHGFLMLTLMTLTILVCYTPGNVYFTILVINGVSVNSLALPAAIMYELNAVLDPLWFVLALPNFRAEFSRTFSCC
ncbi:hypothetical protein RvY_16745 [Ramazzottius varieornatus]|uniref:G-protein coupled receptors family 1 profile domain-containing protein n=1 Tax=Ramazzottius varieornatus TaxID=947166 RepID=A0A1D1W5V0_RAMVA|nr:hypothetical protein RvY_16745 [Ramazzottius varieornatus]